ncbi:uncharacterized protein LAESUDRAFT_563936 [Laetiporus sulphureus 93-53]|uniref:Uncharacterized protein n=1 Tax=Laetiporus sulphureus 93-53 TaxID=1314785 RepID=A0A165B499_9APHY|nr:uncharacterized protein LAESUDRAFT_563936 [Laetiporus sulphureus 93-53]KZT00198.1 hypothetical protein LAESUDRAFT_563936 [Laetiporus sulphureus 93-53]
MCSRTSTRSSSRCSVIASPSRRTRCGTPSYPSFVRSCDSALTFASCSMGIEGTVMPLSISYASDIPCQCVDIVSVCAGQITTIPIPFVNLARALSGPDVKSFGWIVELRTTGLLLRMEKLKDPPACVDIYAYGQSAHTSRRSISVGCQLVAGQLRVFIGAMCSSLMTRGRRRSRLSWAD